MSVVDVIARFGKSGYVVTRTAAGTTTLGRYTAGASSTFSIVASVQPLSGRDLELVPEGQRADETKKIYTTTELRTRTPTHEPDKVVIDGDTYEIFNVQKWEAFGTTHYRALGARLAAV